MRSTGIVRKVDELGRIVIPRETRKLLFVHEGDSLEIFEDDKEIILRKYTPGCIFCGDMNDISQFKGSHICGNCRNELKKL